MFVIHEITQEPPAKILASVSCALAGRIGVRSTGIAKPGNARKKNCERFLRPGGQEGIGKRNDALKEGLRVEA